MKRIYVPKAAYLITTNPKWRINYFDEDVLAAIFIETTRTSIKLKQGFLIAYKVNPEHVHLIIQVGIEFNISQVMHSIKRVSSDRINQILTFNRDPHLYTNFEWSKDLLLFKKRFLSKYGEENQHEYPHFQWNRSFHDLLIRTKHDLIARIKYLENQHIKHELTENKWLYVCNQLPHDLNFIGGKR